MKRIIAILLLVCLLATYLAMGAFAAGISPRYYRPVTCNTSGTNFRDTPSINGTIYGHFSYGDQMLTVTDPGVDWFNGFPGTLTALYKTYGQIWGYSVSRAFDEIE